MHILVVNIYSLCSTDTSSMEPSCVRNVSDIRIMCIFKNLSHVVSISTLSCSYNIVYSTSILLLSPITSTHSSHVEDSLLISLAGRVTAFSKTNLLVVVLVIKTIVSHMA